MDEHKNTPRETGKIERGEIICVNDNGYEVRSFGRDGITTPPMQALMTGDTFSAGDKVCFFYFNDGTGRIIYKL